MQKFCKDCRFSYKPWFWQTLTLECHHPEIGPKPLRLDPVNGKVEPGGYWICDVNRMSIHDDKCGSSGNFWEKRGG